MTRTPLGLNDLLSVVDDDRSIADLRRYFQPDLARGRAPEYSGSRFEFFAGGGDRPDTAGRITCDDLIAVTLLAVDVPGDAALQLFEGDLGDRVSRQLEQIPTDVDIDQPEAAGHFAVGSPARQAWDLLNAPHGMGWVTAGKLLARKRPRLIPVYDRVVRCAYGRPDGVWNWLVRLFAADDGALSKRLCAARDAAGVSDAVTPLRVLDVIMWMRHREDHRRGNCAS
jgi:Family of unknown function (DUF6308)